MKRRTLSPRKHGKDVEAAKRAVYRAMGRGELSSFVKKPDAVRRFYGWGFAKVVRQLQKNNKLPITGKIDDKTYAWLKRNKWYDQAALDLEREWWKEEEARLEKKRLAAEKAAAEKKMKELAAKYTPNQGWRSLHSSLHKAYTIGRSYGFSDLGTYNGASLLPSGARSDHAVYPAFAFDLGIDPDLGWYHEKARQYVQHLANNAYELGVEYVILGDKIWSRYNGWGYYGSGGHMNHIHVSGVR
jgi:hypothetical protein